MTPPARHRNAATASNLSIKVLRRNGRGRSRVSSPKTLVALEMVAERRSNGDRRITIRRALPHRPIPSVPAAEDSQSVTS